MTQPRAIVKNTTARSSVKIELTICHSIYSAVLCEYTTVLGHNQLIPARGWALDHGSDMYKCAPPTHPKTPQTCYSLLHLQA